MRLIDERNLKSKEQESDVFPGVQQMHGIKTNENPNEF